MLSVERLSDESVREKSVACDENIREDVEID
jgi:hypothetical protein